MVTLGLLGGPSVETAEPPSLMIATYTDEHGKRQIQACMWPSFLRQMTWCVAATTMLRAVMKLF